MSQTAEIGGRTPTARCRCTNPKPGIVLENQSGELIEILCVKCRGAIRQQEERAQEQQAHERFDGDPRKLAGYRALEDMRKRATYSQGGYISSIEEYTFTTSGKFDGDPKKLAGYVSFEDMWQDRFLSNTKE
jgi:hypothetical protein